MLTVSEEARTSYLHVEEKLFLQDAHLNLMEKLANEIINRWNSG